MTNLSGTNLNNGTAVGPQGEGRESPSRFPTYPGYRDSGVEWLGEVPQHWVVTKFSRHFSVRMGETIPETELSDEGWLPVYSATERDKFYGYVDERKPLVANGDLVIPARGNSIGFVKLVRAPATATQTTIVANVLDHKITDSSYVYYWCLGLRKVLFYFDRTAIPQITTEYVSRNPLLLPALAEQTQIARFLDHETARIDALIEEQQRLIELLTEKRQAVISHAVTKGLDPTVPMKDSGVEWLGEVPAHWEVWKLSHAFDGIGSGTTPPSTEHGWYEGGTIPWITTSELRENVITATKKNVTAEALEKFSALQMHPPGSLAIAMYGATIGRLGILGISATTNQACCVLSSPRSLTPGFTFYWLSGFKEIIISLYATGGGQPNINQDTVASLKVPAPGIEEQRGISDFLDQKAIEHDSLVKEAERVVAFLQERRSALISAAVTGKIDVRGWQPPASAQAPESAVAEAV